MKTNNDELEMKMEDELAHLDLQVHAFELIFLVV